MCILIRQRNLSNQEIGHANRQFALKCTFYERNFPISFHPLRRRKNLAVHLGLDDTVSKREVQKINTYRGVAEGLRPTFPPSLKSFHFVTSTRAPSTRRPLTNFRVRTDGVQGSQLHHNVVWGLEVPNLNFGPNPSLSKFYSIATHQPWHFWY